MTEPDRRLTKALRDVADNGGVMWRVESALEAKRLWSDLKAAALVEFNSWSHRYQPSTAGRAALARSEEK